MMSFYALDSAEQPVCLVCGRIGGVGYHKNDCPVWQADKDAASVVKLRAALISARSKWMQDDAYGYGDNADSELLDQIHDALGEL